MKSFVCVLIVVSLLGSQSEFAQVSSGSTQDTSRIDTLKEASIELRRIPYYYNYPLLVETLYDVTTAINRAANPNFPVGPIPAIAKEVNYGELSNESVACMQGILLRIQAIPRYQESRLLLDAVRSIATAITKARPTKERGW
jgi:hypothetical protein